jgi:hypothetical protein
MSHVHARSAHSLSEILIDHRTTEEKVKGAAKNAPFWVIAIMAHLILVFVFGMVVMRQEAMREKEASIQSELASAVPDLKLDEKPEAPSDEVNRSALPEVDDSAPISPDEFQSATDQVVNPEATQEGQFGISDGDPHSTSDFITTSTGGVRLSGAMGLGGGSTTGGGARKGVPWAGSRVRLRNLQKPDWKIEHKTLHGGLRWLHKHQSPDGSWDCDGFSSCCDHKRGAQCTGRGSAVFDSGVTGLALLAFLGAGYDTVSKNEYAESLRNGLKYLKGIQDAQGCFGPTSDNRHTYSHACATIAMCEAYASSKQIPWRKSAEAAIGYINACQNPYKAWRYGKAPGDNDASVTGWMLLALKAAKDAGIPVNERTMKDGLAFLDSITDEDTGRTGYIKKGELPVRPEGLVGRFPANESEALTAVAMTARIFCDAGDSKLMKAGAELLAKKLPLWDENRGSIDMYYWYYGTLAMFQMGGEHWERWNKNMKAAVIDSQHTDANSCLEGSWDPKDPWGEDGGRVYSTAIMTLCLEVYYRYPKVFGAKIK